MPHHAINDNAYIHLPVHGGVRLKVKDKRFAKLAYHFSDPVAVVEENGRYTAVSSAHDLKINFNEQWSLYSDDHIEG